MIKGVFHLSLRALVGFALLLVGCDPEPAATTTQPAVTATSTGSATSMPPPETTSITTTTTEPPVAVPQPIAGFGLEIVHLDGLAINVAVADDPGERQQGLMGLESLLDLDGMLFVFERDVATGFWMKNTLIPLDIAFFTAEGDSVDGFRMEPCTADPCPVYRPSGAYRYALEMAAGDMPIEVTRLDR